MKPRAMLRVTTAVLALALACATQDSNDGDGGPGPGGKADDADALGGVDPRAYDFRTDDFRDYDEVVDGLGVAFSDTILGRRDNRFSEIGPVNYDVATTRRVIKNFADLAVAFGRDFEEMGFDTCANLSGVDVERTSERDLSLFKAFKVVKGCLFQRVRPEQGSLSPRPMDVFVPNHMKVDFRLVADGELSQFPNGRRPDEQLASNFTSLLLDLDGGICEDDKAAGFDGTRDRPCTVDTLQDGGPESYWDLPLNPVENDVPFIRSNTTGRLAFPYLPGPHSKAPYGRDAQ